MKHFFADSMVPNSAIRFNEILNEVEWTEVRNADSKLEQYSGLAATTWGVQNNAFFVKVEVRKGNLLESMETVA